MYNNQDTVIQDIGYYILEMNLIFESNTNLGSVELILQLSWCLAAKKFENLWPIVNC